MKVELDALTRNAFANVARRRSAELREIAGERTMSAVRQEIEQEAAWWESQAARLENYQDAVTAELPLVRAGGRGDIDYINPAQPGNGEAKSTNAT